MLPNYDKGTGLQQQAHDFRVPVLRRKLQSRGLVDVGQVDLSTGLKQPWLYLGGFRV